MCIKLSFGAVGNYWGFHSRGWCQWNLLPQSHDLTCWRVILQRLWW